MIVYPLLASGGHWRGAGPGQAAPSPTSCPLASARPRADPPGAGISAVGPQPFLSSLNPLQRAKALGVPIPGLCRGLHRKHRSLPESCREECPVIWGLKVTSKVWPRWSLGPECCAPRTRTRHARLRGSRALGCPAAWAGGLGLQERRPASHPPCWGQGQIPPEPPARLQPLPAGPLPGTGPEKPPTATQAGRRSVMSWHPGLSALKCQSN